MTIYTITYNEELILPYFIRHYRLRFPNCKIVVYDNESTDETTKIAKENNCEVITYSTNNKLSDSKYLEIKNNCWKGQTDWVIVADCDEFLDIWESDLENEEASIISVEAYNMVNLEDNLDILGITHGVRSTSYDKAYCFNASKIHKINYGAGCHSCSPERHAKYFVEDLYSKKKYEARHYKYINIDFMIERHRVYGSRLSEENLKKDWGTHYLYSPEQIRNEFLTARKNAIKLL